jgi:hypothetical protein
MIYYFFLAGDRGGAGDAATAGSLHPGQGGDGSGSGTPEQTGEAEASQEAAEPLPPSRHSQVSG